MDVHLVPHHLADVEPAVLAGCARGVPTIATDFGAASETLGSHARLVPPSAMTYASDGSVVALMDTGRALRELGTLLDPAGPDPAAGRGMRTPAEAALDADAAGAWHRHLESLWTAA